MMLTTLNLKIAFLINHYLNQAIKQNQIVKNHHCLKRFSITVEKTVIQSHHILNDKPKNIVRSILNQGNLKMLNLKTDTQKSFKDFFKSNQILPERRTPNFNVSPHEHHNRSS